MTAFLVFCQLPQKIILTHPSVPFVKKKKKCNYSNTLTMEVHGAKKINIIKLIIAAGPGS